MNANGASRPSAAPERLLRLVQLCDSALPVGAYAQSWGLEAYIAGGLVPGPHEVELWVQSWLQHAIAPGEGVIVAHSTRRAAEGDWAGLADLNDLMAASRPVPTIRKASCQQGEALVDLAATWPWSSATALALRSLDRGPWNHAVVFGAIAQAAGGDVGEVVALYLQNAAVGAVSAAVRGVPIGHTHGQQILAYLQPSVAEFSAASARAPIESYGGLSPSYEVMCHAQYQLYARMFQS